MDALIIVAFALVNRLRGGGIHGLRGSGRNYAVPFVIVLAWLAGAHSVFASQWDPLIFGACWFAWCLPPWGPWINLGYEPYNFPQTGVIKRFEALINEATGDSAFLGLGLRMLIGLIPMAVFFSMFYLALAPVMVGCYFLGWQTRIQRFHNIDAIMVSEFLVGLAWGAALVILH